MTFRAVVAAFFVCLTLAPTVLLSQSGPRPDIVVADFEGGTYGDWSVTGTAFGSGPARGALPHQMPVDGYSGKGLVNSYWGGDEATGTLTSPPFKIERKFMQFLIGGGGHAGRTCVNLLLDGRVIRTATGNNTRPGGSEHLEARQWDVSALAGSKVTLQIVDSATGVWGHINLDQIVQTDAELPGALVDEAIFSFQATNRFLNLPVKNGAASRHLRLTDGKSILREFDIELADGAPDWWTFVDLSVFPGARLELQADALPENFAARTNIHQAEKIRGAEPVYQEALRPQFHFSSQRGWLNDPNGLVFYQGEYHLFYQHNPYGWLSGNLTWGHAFSRDLVHWRELPNALYPDDHGAMWSGSAVVDWNNTAGFQTGTEAPVVCMFCEAGEPFTQGLAFSNDRGRTWTKYSGNPVLSHIAAENRDPKVIRYGNRWVMALYLEGDHYALFSSSNLKQWEKTSDVTLPGDSECPEFFEIALDGNSQDTRWIFYGGKARYLVGRFDGRVFTPESGPHELQHGNCFYASQTFNNIPDADRRRILIPWGTVTMPGMPFNQMMGLPVELTLWTTDEGPRLRAVPVRELDSLRTKRRTVPPQALHPGDNPLAGMAVELADITAEIAVSGTDEIGFNLRGVNVIYNVKSGEVVCGDRRAALKPDQGKIRLRLLVDRTSVDIFANDGRLYMPMGVIVPRDNKSLQLWAKGGAARIDSLEVNELASCWNRGD